MDNNWKLPDEIEIGLFYAPAPISEHWYGVIDAETKTEPLQRRKYTAAPTPDNNGWRDISTAPRDGRHIAVLTESGSLVRAFWGWVDDELAWMAVTEGEHPSCWTDGICWKSNADGERSDPPECWLPLPPPPALDKGE